MPKIHSEGLYQALLLYRMNFLSVKLQQKVKKSEGLPKSVILKLKIKFQRSNNNLKK